MSDVLMGRFCLACLVVEHEVGQGGGQVLPRARSNAHHLEPRRLYLCCQMVHRHITGGCYQHLRNAMQFIQCRSTGGWHLGLAASMSWGHDMLAPASALDPKSTCASKSHPKAAVLCDVLRIFPPLD